MEAHLSLSANCLQSCNRGRTLADVGDRMWRVARQCVLAFGLFLTACSGGLPGVGGGGEPPRERTLIITPWGAVPQIGHPEIYNIYQTSTYNHQREAGDKAMYEALMYTNLNTGEIIPWQAESFKYNDDYTSITVKLRKGITWADGQPFTSGDVKYTLEMLRDNAPDLTYSTIYKEWLKNVGTPDDLMAPYPPWEAWRLIIHHLQPVK